MGASVDAVMSKKIDSTDTVLFMEGTPDAPKSARSYNVIKMLTNAQHVKFTAVDTTAHPAILGYTVSRSGRESGGPQLYMKGNFVGDHDAILRKFGSKGAGNETHGTFAGDKPIGTY